MESMESRMNQTSEGVEEQVSADSVEFGDVIYVKLHGDSWWPAQVVDGERITGNVKPVKRRAKDVLVRLYGSCTFLYVDPIESCSEFKMVLRNNNWDLKKKLEEALVKVPLSHISDVVYKTSTDWINHRSPEALSSFLLWSLDRVLADLGSQHSVAKGSKKAVQQVTSKSQDLPSTKKSSKAKG